MKNIKDIKSIIFTTATIAITTALTTIIFLSWATGANSLIEVVTMFK